MRRRAWTVSEIHPPSRPPRAASRERVFILSGCSSPVDVHVDVVRLRDLSATVSADCLIRAHRTVRVTAGASGRVSRLAVSEGTRVTAGDLLVELAPDRLDADVQAVAAAVGAERSAVERARVAGRSARLAADRARSRSERVSALWSRGFTSYEEHADAVAEVAAKQAGVRRSEAVLAQAAARLRSTEVELARVRESAREARVVAPLSGVVTRLHVAAGQQVVAGQGRYLGSSLVFRPTGNPRREENRCDLANVHRDVFRNRDYLYVRLSR